MFKKYSKKIFVFSALFMSIFMFTSTVFAEYDFVLNKVGETYMEYSETKLKGNIMVKAVHYPQKYNGEIQLQLQRKELLGYKTVGNRQNFSTYNLNVTCAYWDTSKYVSYDYRGFIELTQKDTNSAYNGLSGYLSVSENNN